MDVQWQPGESGCSVACLVRYSTYSTYSKEPRESVKLDGPPQQRLQRVLATHTAGVSVDGYTLTLAANPWNIVRTYNLTPG